MIKILKISCPKFIHAKYCDNLFHCKKLADGTHYHLEEVYTNVKFKINFYDVKY